MITALTAARDAADQDVIIAGQAVADANALLDATKAKYAAGYGGIKHGDTLTLYSADGNAVRADGVAVYRNTIDAANKGDQVPVVARITSLFLLDDNGDPVEALVFDATSDLNYQLPVGAATFASDSMVAFFAQQEGDGVYTIQSSDAAGTLTLDFNSQSGNLVVLGLPNGQNKDYAISANLVFDPQTGVFAGKGSQVQAYTSSNGAETANALISGNLHGVAEAFTASITATDTIAGGIPVKIMTELVGTGSIAK